ncbi:hypothetical protein J7K24_01815 [bacterium]|nr:hypothetical protein [bacterium]
MKKIFPLIVLFSSLIILYIPQIVLADGTYSVRYASTGAIYTFQYKGLVPCGKCVQSIGGAAPAFVTIHEITDATTCQQSGYYWQGGVCYMCDVAGGYRYVPCTLCHLLVMIEGAINFILIEIVPVVAVLILVVGGIILYFGGLSPSQLNQARSVLISAIIGLVIIYGAWVIVNTVLITLGIASWVGFGGGWFQIQCEIVI